MQLILKKNVDKLGYRDDVVSVKPGYGRNFLIPQGYAVIATESSLKAHNEMIKQRSHKETKIKEEAQALATKLENLLVKIGAKVGENDKIFGSVNTIQISEALAKEGIEVDRKSIKIIQDPIKQIGTYDAEVNLHKEVKQTFKFEVIGE